MKIGHADERHHDAGLDLAGAGHQAAEQSATQHERRAEHRR